MLKIGHASPEKHSDSFQHEKVPYLNWHLIMVRNSEICILIHWCWEWRSTRTIKRQARRVQIPSSKNELWYLGNISWLFSWKLFDRLRLLPCLHSNLAVGESPLFGKGTKKILLHLDIKEVSKQWNSFPSNIQLSGFSLHMYKEHFVVLKQRLIYLIQ